MSVTDPNVPGCADPYAWIRWMDTYLAQSLLPKVALGFDRTYVHSWVLYTDVPARLAERFQVFEASHFEEYRAFLRTIRMQPFEEATAAFQLIDRCSPLVPTAAYYDIVPEHIPSDDDGSQHPLYIPFGSVLSFELFGEVLDTWLKHVASVVGTSAVDEYGYPLTYLHPQCVGTDRVYTIFTDVIRKWNAFTEGFAPAYALIEAWYPFVAQLRAQEEETAAETSCPSTKYGVPAASDTSMPSHTGASPADSRGMLLQQTAQNVHTARGQTDTGVSADVVGVEENGSGQRPTGPASYPAKTDNHDDANGTNGHHGNVSSPKRRQQPRRHRPRKQRGGHQRHHRRARRHLSLSSSSRSSPAEEFDGKLGAVDPDERDHASTVPSLPTFALSTLEGLPEPIRQRIERDRAAERARWEGHHRDEAS